MNHFVRVPKWVLRPEVFRTLSHTSIVVLTVLADCLESNADCGRISVRSLGERTGLKRRTVQIALKTLGDAGVIERYGPRGEFRYLPDPRGASTCAPAHQHAPQGAPACAGGRTTVREGAHEHARTVGRNKERPRSFDQELSTKNAQEQRPIPSEGITPEGGGDRLTGGAMTEHLSAFAQSVGWKRPDYRDLDALRETCWNIHLGDYPEIDTEGQRDPLGYLRSRLSDYWAEQEQHRRENPTLKAPSLRKSLQEGRWRRGPGQPGPTLDPEQEAKREALRAARAERKAVTA